MKYYIPGILLIHHISGSVQIYNDDIFTVIRDNGTIENTRTIIFDSKTIHTILIRIYTIRSKIYISTFTHYISKITIFTHKEINHVCHIYVHPQIFPLFKKSFTGIICISVSICFVFLLIKIRILNHLTNSVCIWETWSNSVNFIKYIWLPRSNLFYKFPSWSMLALFLHFLLSIL